MENRYREIASSNQGFPIVNQFLDETGVKDNAINFAKNFLRNRFNKKDNSNKEEETLLENNGNQNISAIEKTKNLLNRINQTGITADLSGVGFEKTFGDENQGINTTVFGRQNFGGPTEYGAKLGFNYKF